MLTFRNFKVGFLFFLGLSILLGQELFAPPPRRVGGLGTDGGGVVLQTGNNTNATAIGQHIDRLEARLEKEKGGTKDPVKIKNLETQIEKYEKMFESSVEEAGDAGEAFDAAAEGTSFRGITRLRTLKGFGIFLFLSIAVFPFIETAKSFTTTILKDRVWIAFEGLVGGLTTKTIRTTIHCQQLFKSTRDLIALVMRLSAREVGAGMDTRIRVPNGQTAADKDAQKPSESSAQEAYKCPICHRSDGAMEFFFDCKDGVDHGMHPECAIKFFAAAGDKNCPICKSDRKFDVMSPDVIIASMIDKLNIKSELQSHILILKAAQKKINGLIKQMSKCHDKNKYLTERTMLLAVSMDISRLIDLLKKIICQNDFFNQENLKKLDVCAAVGDFNCQTLLKYIKGSRDDVSGLRRDGIGSGYSGSGLGNGFGSGLGGSGF